MKSKAYEDALAGCWPIESIDDGEHNILGRPCVEPKKGSKSKKIPPSELGCFATPRVGIMKLWSAEHVVPRKPASASSSSFWASLAPSSSPGCIIWVKLVRRMGRSCCGRFSAGSQLTRFSDGISRSSCRPALAFRVVGSYRVEGDPKNNLQTEKPLCYLSFFYFAYVWAN